MTWGDHPSWVTVSPSLPSYGGPWTMTITPNYDIASQEDSPKQFDIQFKLTDGEVWTTTTIHVIINNVNRAPGL